jgi:glycosyltransferase involved in cell wall biosynthesis
MSKISIIVPVYNTEDKLEKCLESLVKQTMNDIEIVIVNDGSTDNSEEIIKKFKKEYPSIIKYYLKENTGISDTRNYGIEKAESDYIMYIDSDDYIEKDTLEKLNKYIEQEIELIKFKLQKVDENGNILEKFDGPIFEKCTGEEAFEKLYGTDLMLVSPCVYLIKKEVFTRNQFKFLGKYHEDFGLIPFIVVTAKSVVSTPYYLYNYVQGEESITRTVNYDKIVERAEQTLYQYDQMIETLKRIKLSKRAEENIKIYFTNATILKAEELKEKERIEYIKKIKLRKMYRNIRPRNLKQLIKRIILKSNIELYLKIR